MRVRRETRAIPELARLRRLQSDSDYAGMSVPQLLRVCRLYEALEARGARRPLYVARRLIACDHLDYLHRWAWALRRSGLEAQDLADALTEAEVTS